MTPFAIPEISEIPYRGCQYFGSCGSAEKAGRWMANDGIPLRRTASYQNFHQSDISSQLLRITQTGPRFSCLMSPTHCSLLSVFPY